MRIYRDIHGSEVAFVGVGTPAQGMVSLTMHEWAYTGQDSQEFLQDMGNARECYLSSSDEPEAHPRNTIVTITFAHDNVVYRFEFDTLEEAKELRKEFEPYVGERFVPNCVEVPEDATGMQRLTWTIAGALNQFDPKIDAHGDGADIIDFINSYGVETPM